MSECKVCVGWRGERKRSDDAFGCLGCIFSLLGFAFCLIGLQLHVYGISVLGAKKYKLCTHTQHITTLFLKFIPLLRRQHPVNDARKHQQHGPHAITPQAGRPPRLRSRRHGAHDPAARCGRTRRPCSKEGEQPAPTPAAARAEGCQLPPLFIGWCV